MNITTNDEKMRKVQKNAIYRHFKGNYYQVMEIAYDATNIDPLNRKMVVYKSLNDGMIYTRDLKEFLSEVDHIKYPDVKQRYRFEKININEILKTILNNVLTEDSYGKH